MTYIEMKKCGLIYGCQYCDKEGRMTALEFNDAAETLDCPVHGAVWPNAQAEGRAACGESRSSAELGGTGEARS